MMSTTRAGGAGKNQMLNACVDNVTMPRTIVPLGDGFKR